MGAWWLCSLASALTLLSHSTEAMRLGPASGLLVDWLETLDPEVVCSCPDLQWKLLFSRRKVTGTWPSALPQCCHSRLLCLVASRGVGGTRGCMFPWVNTRATSGAGAGMG